MKNRSRVLLDILRKDLNLDWVADQLTSSFTEGIAHSAKDVTTLTQGLMFGGNVTQREKAKREKYEMSRPYDEDEKMELIEFALSEVFETLPEMQSATAIAHNLAHCRRRLSFLHQMKKRESKVPTAGNSIADETVKL